MKIMVKLETIFIQTYTSRLNRYVSSVSKQNSMMNITDNNDNIDEETETGIGREQTYKVKKGGVQQSFCQR